ncbi:hypothetical protein CY34DRAFT_19371 [Suillus luteus UH-Slu-Lm8-n1]|uniref:Uncharacterized protein n=1 Tax=Suillus luteus UH-Slu-Lm8-n1 TaxID=930992 RepID=A0A0C9Z3S0_9AGAM|nr:hypothetical protein CY34DRAFT_19371 [Suillus luteus UH-Slu-Lm8-n1]
MPSDSTFNAEEDANLDVSELANIFTDDPPQKSISKGKKKMTPLVDCIDDANDADGEWLITINNSNQKSYDPYQ